MAVGFASLGGCHATLLGASQNACLAFQRLVWETYAVLCSGATATSLTFTDYVLATGAPASYAPETFAVSFAPCDTEQSVLPFALSDTDAASLTFILLGALCAGVAWRACVRALRS